MVSIFRRLKNSVGGTSVMELAIIATLIGVAGFMLMGLRAN
jgi:hypothetical protein